LLSHRPKSIKAEVNYTYANAIVVRQQSAEAIIYDMAKKSHADVWEALLFWMI
jgi:uncharacterized lipoprotein YehR (DUF1307 family)